MLLNPSETQPPTPRLVGHTPKRWAVPILLAAVAGGAIIAYGTLWGPWAYSDGVGYLVNARNLVLGRGLGLYRASGDFILLITHPPLYPLMLAGLGSLGVPLVAAARWIDVVLFAGFLAAAGLGFQRLSRSGWLALGLTVCLLVQPAIVLAYLSAMSEPLFLICILLCLLSLAAHLAQPNRKLLILSAGAAAGALMTRYPGAALVAAGALALAVLSRADRRRRLRESLTFLSIGVVPTLAFILWSQLALQSRTPRGLKSSLDLLGLLKSFVAQAAASIWDWKPVPPDVIPNSIVPIAWTRPIAGALALIMAGALAAAVILALRARAEQPVGQRAGWEWRPAALFGLFILGHLGFVLTAYLVTNPTPDIDQRTLLPVLLVGLLLAFAVMHGLLNLARPSILLRATLVVLVVLSVTGWAIISQDTILGMHRTGLGYTSKAWQASETMAAVRQLPADLTLVSNETAAILLYTDRSAFEVPGLESGDAQMLSIPFGSGNSDLERDYQEGRAALVVFDSLEHQLKGVTQATPSDLTQGLRLLFKGKDGAIYCRCEVPAPGSGDVFLPSRSAKMPASLIRIPGLPSAAGRGQAGR